MENFQENAVKVLYENAAATVLVDREQKLNALNSQVLEELYEVFDRIGGDQNVRVVVLSGSGSTAFAAGADLAEAGSKTTVEALRAYYAGFDRVYAKIAEIPQPVIARVNGYAFGGGALLALSCDLVVASEKSLFSQPEIDFGFTGGASLLPRLVGRHIAAELTLLGRKFTAEEAFRWNLINRVVEEARLDETVKAMADSLIKKNPLALAAIKRCLRNSLEAPLSVACRYETEASAVCLAAAGSKAQINAFLSRSNK